MICSSCLHAIQRTYMNGPQFKYVKNHCDIDGQEIGMQIVDCTRLEEKVVYVPPTQEEIEKMVTKLEMRQLSEPVIFPPLEEVAKKKGWPKGKPRAKRK